MNAMETELEAANNRADNLQSQLDVSNQRVANLQAELVNVRAQVSQNLASNNNSYLLIGSRQ